MWSQVVKLSEEPSDVLMWQRDYAEQAFITISQEGPLSLEC